MPVLQLNYDDVVVRHQDKVKVILACSTAPSRQLEGSVAVPLRGERFSAERTFNFLMRAHFGLWYPGLLYWDNSQERLLTSKLIAQLSTLACFFLWLPC